MKDDKDFKRLQRAIRKYLDEHPETTFGDLARMFGIDRKTLIKIIFSDSGRIRRFDLFLRNVRELFGKL
ncbi:MAG: hypothetical protein WCY21_05895 [Candidatus Cloacimonadaceae bacterium]|nr:hypothetical protein [Candidatus Cloacimonadota bacterium]MDX9949225.1 hypothetical protein [Candidatus Syntrophosphaera sp.]